MYSGIHPKQLSDTGYVVGWKYKYKFERGHLEGEMTYGEARKKAEELRKKEPEKTFWPEKVLELL